MTNYQLPLILKPIRCADNSLFGEARDGGYYLPVSVVKSSDLLFGGGVSTSWHFEQDLLRVKKDIKIYLYDGSISFLIFFLRLIFRPSFANFKILIKFSRDFYILNKFCFRRKWICEANGPNSTDLSEHFKRRNGILKIDIEGAEYGILGNIHEHRINLNALIIEFHHVEENLKTITNFVSQMSESFFISYVNINNYTVASPANPLGIAIEIVMVNRKFLGSLNKIGLANNPELQCVKIEYF